MITVSIVDDEKELRQSITTFVNGSAGFRCVSTYSNAETALKGLPVDKPKVVLMDINLGGMNGIECVERLKAVAPEMQILMHAALDVHELLQRMKLHPLFRQYLEGGELVEWGAKTIPEGGYYAVPARRAGDVS